MSATATATASPRSFRLLLLGLAVSSCGDWLYNVALLALVYARTGSSTWIAITTAGRVLPIVVLGPIGGVLADRYDRRRLIMASDVARALLMIALAAVAAAGLPLALAPLLAAAATAVGTVHAPCVAASTPRLVADDQLQRANGMRAAIGQAAIVVGPALGALVLALSSPAFAILANALTFIVSAAAVAAIPSGEAFRPSARDDADSASLLDEVRIGARALRGAPVAVRLVAADTLCSAVYGLLTVVLVLVGHRIGAGAGGYGLLLGAFGVGGVAGATIAGRLDGASTWRRTLAGALVLVALPLAALGLANAIAPALVLAFAAGGGMVVGEVLSETALPRLLDDAVLARAYGLALPASLAGIVAGSLVAGPLVASLGVTGTLLLAGSFVLAVAALLLRRPIEVPIAGPAAATLATC
jgi:predicted MFS family arabinose efflux permease